MRIRIGTRGSDLALWQARHVAAALERGGHACEVVVLETRGDRIDDVPLQSVEGKGFFTKELEDALSAGRVDLAVHSHKDLPSAQPDGLAIAAVPPRASAEEWLLASRDAHDPSAAFLPLARGTKVGTSAPRRGAQLLALRPDLELASLRGNVPTRVRRLREGRYGAIVLAAAGLERLELDLAGLAVAPLPLDLVVPAPAQGALAVQTRADDRALRAECERLLHDPLAAATVAAERELLVRLGGGCNLPLGVALVRDGDAWRGHAFLGAGHPAPAHPSRWCTVRASDPATASAALAERLLAGERTGDGPLAGLAVALAGTRHGAAELAERLAGLGARVEREEVLAIEDLAAPELAARAAALRAGDVLAVTSANAARRLEGLRLASGVRVAAVGSATAAALAAAGLAADVVGETGARELASRLELAPGARVLFPCAADARTELDEALTSRGVAVERVVLYRTRTVPDAALASRADVRVLLSPSAVAALAGRLHRGHGAACVALGPSTAAALDSAGVAHVAAATTGPEDVLAAVLTASRSRARR